MDNVKDKVERWKLLADVFMKNDSKVFIKQINGDLHFCNIFVIEDDSILVDNFAPIQRKGKREKIWWFEIEEFEEYKKKEEKKIEVDRSGLTIYNNEGHCDAFFSHNGSFPLLVEAVEKAKEVMKK